MKTIFRFLVLAMLLATFSAATVTTSFAQDPAAEKKALYDTHIANYASTDPDKLQLALDAAKSYVAKFPEDKEQVTYYTAEVTRLEKAIADAKEVIVVRNKKIELQKLYVAFDNATKAKDVPAIFTSGKAILAQQPEFLDVIITLANAGFDEVAKDPKSSYTADTVNYATSAIQKIEAGQGTPSKTYGGINYELGNKDNALRYLNYIVGFTMSVAQDKKKDALPYFYKSAKLETSSNSIPLVYQAIGAYYLDEALKIDTERKKVIAANGGKDTPESLEMEANQRGYADRAIDAYARAYKVAKAGKAPKKEYVDGLYGKLTDLYKFRYDNKTEGIDAYVASVQSKPLPDPTTPITPVKVEVPDPTAPTTPTTPTTPNGSSAPPTTPKPATTTPVKPATTPTPKPATTPTADATVNPATDKTSPKKPAPKKKGTR